MLCVCLDGANWLTFFCQPVKSWNGLILRKPIDMEKRELIQRQEATLLDLRSYLFSRQCTLLLFLQRPCEVAQRALELLHSCVQELQLLEVSRPAPPRPVRTEPAPRPCPNAGAWDSFPPDVRGFSVFVVTLDADYIIAGEHGFHSQRDGVRVGPRRPAGPPRHCHCHSARGVLCGSGCSLLGCSPDRHARPALVLSRPSARCT